MKVYIFSGDYMEDGVAVVIADSEEEAREMMVDSLLDSPCHYDLASSSSEWWRVEVMPLEKACVWPGGGV